MRLNLIQNSKNLSIKSNYNKKDIYFCYKPIKSSSKKHINKSKNKSLEEGIFIKNNIKNISKINYIKSPSKYYYNNKNIEDNNKISINIPDNIDNIEFNINDINNIRKELNHSSKNRKIIKNNSVLKNLCIKTTTKNAIGIVPFNKKEKSKSIFNKKQIYKKPKNERLFSPKIVSSEKNSNSCRSALNVNRIYQMDLIQNNKKFFYNNIDKLKKDKILSQNPDDIILYNSPNKNNDKYSKTTESKNNYFYKKKQPVRKNSILFNNLNLYDTNDNNDFSYSKYHAFLDDNINENLFIQNLNYVYNSSNNNDTIQGKKSIVYERNNTYDKKCIKKHLTDNNLYFEKKKNTNTERNSKLKSDNIFDNIYYYQEKIILIQKIYRAHLSHIKRYILKAIRDIIIAVNKIYFVFYKNYFKKFRYIILKFYINKKIKDKSIQNIKIKNNYNYNVYNNNSIGKYYLKSHPTTIQKLNINNSHKKNNSLFSYKLKSDSKSRIKDFNF